jgi:hypothetical protein
LNLRDCSSCFLHCRVLLLCALPTAEFCKYPAVIRLHEARVVHSFWKTPRERLPKKPKTLSGKDHEDLLEFPDNDGAGGWAYLRCTIRRRQECMCRMQSSWVEDDDISCYVSWDDKLLCRSRQLGKKHSLEARWLRSPDAATERASSSTLLYVTTLSTSTTGPPRPQNAIQVY